MGLPVHQIISALEDQMRDVEEYGDEGVRGGLEDEDATGEDLIPDLGWLKSTNKHPHPLIQVRGLLLQ